MLFDDLKRQAASGGDISIPGTWAQGRTVYGGLSAGLLCDMMSRGVGKERRLRYLKTDFLKPLVTETPFRIETEEISAGRTLIVRSARIIQDGSVRVMALANFVTELESAVEVETFRAPTLKPWNADGAFPMRGPGFPAFTQNIDFHTTTGGLPFHGPGEPELGGWMRFRNPPESFHKPELVCLIDTWPPSPACYFPEPVPMSTINWSIHFGDRPDGLDGSEYLGYLAHTNFLKDGYGSSSADIWAPDGRLLAKSFQTFVIYG